MTGDVRELLPLYALGILESEEARVVERAVAANPELAAELAAYQQTAGELGSVIQPVAPSPEVKQRLMASVGGGRFGAFAARLAKLYDVTVERAHELLGLMDRTASWRPQIPGVSLIDFDGGPAAAAADCGFFKLSPGALFPPHKHLGEERTIILAGQIRDVVNDRICSAGDEYVQVEGTSHYLQCVGPEECIYAARAINGIDVGTGGRARPIN
jgi:anti-sigma factor ChrR (cupin superfamily)